MSGKRRRAGRPLRSIPPALPQRSFRTNASVAVILSAVAGALNAGGFFAVGIYTSHVTGTWSRMCDELALANFAVAAKFLGFVAAFVAGAVTSTFLVEHNPATARRVRYLKPLVLEILLLAAFVALGEQVPSKEHW